MQAGAAIAAEQGVELEWREADAHALPFGDNEFDVVMSCIGVMFAPFHQQSAGELIRVCKPGGRLWAAQLDTGGPHRSALRNHEAVHAAPAARGAAAPAVGSRGPRPCAARRSSTDVVTERRTLTVDHFADGAGSGTTSRVYGPTIAAYRNIEGDADRVAALDADIARIGDGFLDGSDTMEWEYLLLTARKG